MITKLNWKNMKTLITFMKHRVKEFMAKWKFEIDSWIMSSREI